ncbi:hypothetical protein ACWCO0_00770 [Streptomyces tubercidicus]|uniref:Membrane protein n=1 Tax=Streptomyces tubercidicus TaxID=47759 RepID=A0A640USK7_9ACTN|nr:hypothetical protein [Streptomyces tubercidicus]WAU13008.1 hypothetical protein STRTU_003446 [Streptomyces tubercidicus]GFE38547.1 membrane protein [Streptomyces tubercidicus]
MHMNSAPHLLNEDRAEFARLLDEALRTAPYRPDNDLTAAAGHPLQTEQLRTMALSATTAIAACATAEYQRYVQLRAELRAPAPLASVTDADGAEQNEAPYGRLGPDSATALDEAETTGAGLTAMIAVLAPVLAGIAAVLFLLIGYVLRAVSLDTSLAQPLISVGWIFAALTAVGTLVAMAGLVITALRNGASAQVARAEEPAEALDQAHEAWRRALLERGLLPFLHAALTDPTATPDDDPARYVPRRGTSAESRIPTLGYTRPQFTSPDSGSSGPRPRYSSPDFTSPDYGGADYGGADQRPDHQPD